MATKIGPTRSADLRVPVVFTFPGQLIPGAREVSLLGPFNAWTPKVHRLSQAPHNTWTIRVPLPPGRIAYCYDVDGACWLDPEDQGRVPNDWGTEYSLREVSPGSRRPAPPTRHDLRSRPIRGGSQELALECSLGENQGARVVVVSGEVDLATISLLRDALSQAVEGRRSVIVDISRLQYIDSTGLSELLNHHRRAQTRNQHFVLAGPSRLLSKLLQITHLTEAIPMFPSVADALASCQRPPESDGAALANDRV